MYKREDSLRSIGLTTISVDKCTKILLRTAASTHKLNLSEYMRVLASANWEQGRLVKDTPASDVNLPAISSKLDCLIRTANRPLKDVILEALAEYQSRHDERAYNKQGASQLSLEGGMIASP